MLSVCEKCHKRLKDINIGDFNISENCVVCCGIFDHIPELAIKITETLKDYEFNNFSIGLRLRGSIKAIEDFLKYEFGIEDNLKQHFNKELVKELEKITGRTYKVNGDIRILIDLETLDFDVEAKNVYIYGKYKKRVRNFSQTRWLCGYCDGKGCEMCNGTGRKYLSVEEFIISPIIDKFKSSNAFLHGAGREDVDVRMLGSGRPFVVEIVNPRKRSVKLNELEREINQKAGGKIEVKLYNFCNRDLVAHIKNAKFRKVYRAVVVFEREVDETSLKNALRKLECEISQRTPKRVLHRRADLIRKRKVFLTKLVLLKDKRAVIIIEAESGLYIKELINGDEGRTKPSLSEILNLRCDVERLDVIEVKDDKTI